MLLNDDGGSTKHFTISSREAAGFLSTTSIISHSHLLLASFFSTPWLFSTSKLLTKKPQHSNATQKTNKPLPVDTGDEKVVQRQL
jgi:hypothetical protein